MPAQPSTSSPSAGLISIPSSSVRASVSAPAVIKPVPDPAPGVWLEPSRMAQNLTSEMHTLVREDATPARAFCKNRAIKHILSTLFPATLSRPKTGVELNLYFGHRVFRKVVRIPCIWKSPSNVDVSFDSCPTLPSTSFGQVPKTGGREPGMPMLAYINKAQLASIRKHLYGVVRGPENTINEPVRRLQKLRSKMLVPENPDHDPYIVAILIGLAQAHFYRETSRPSSQSSSQGSRKSIRIKPPVFRDVKVQVITHDDGNDSSPNFIIYTATVTATFLKRFMHPDLAPSEDATAGLDITYTPVSFWPILGLKERLSQALGREIAADSIYDNPNYIGLWDPLLELQHPPVRQPVCQPVYQSVRLKRRRGAERHAAAAAGGEGRQPLSQVLNSSFEDEAAAALSSSPEDRPVISPTAKRRRASRSVGPLQVMMHLHEALDGFGVMTGTVGRTPAMA
ncbi:hypothetical protein N0V88_007194 [Collariella sp. IMI 366227]|nr:hypothetical protein N0V88_007194 [Collariella sp. IMI 366227]